MFTLSPKAQAGMLHAPRGLSELQSSIRLCIGAKILGEIRTISDSFLVSAFRQKEPTITVLF